MNAKGLNNVRPDNKMPVTFGIVGCGSIARWHTNALKEIANTRVAGVYDAFKPSADKLAAELGATSHATYENLLADPEIMVVNICTPSGLHAPQAIQALNAGKHVVIEKPMALSPAEADTVIEAAERNNRRVEVISQLRSTQAIRRLKKAVAEGEFGRVVSADIYMKFYRSREYYTSSNWRGTWAMDGGGALMNQGIHGVDLLLFVMGEVKSVYGIGRTLVHNIETEDTLSAVLEFKCGALGVVQATTSVYPGDQRILAINGSEGSAQLQEDKIFRWETTRGELPEDVSLGTSDVLSAQDPLAFSTDGHTRQLSAFVRALRSGEPNAIDAHEGKKAVELICAIYEASRTGRPVYFPWDGKMTSP
ncbi:MAG: Gfo/Idh/MocA family oxidoreductase [Clostridiaceae bacterium]|nr:Gfo/Idh/MocA family oxidoreductase [Clostridiaceae bacterium]